MTTDFTFLHAADLHIDSPLRGLERYEEAPVEAIRGATRRAFENLVSCALERRVEFVILAGDVFDGDWKDHGTGLWFAARLRELTEAGIRVYLLAGNHDAQGRMTMQLDYPEGVCRFASDAPQSFVDAPTGAVLHGQSFARQKVDDNLAAGYPVATAGALNIGVLHTALGGRANHDNYAPCSKDDLLAKGYDYWALGHVHQREVVAEAPWIVFPGNLQARHVRETGAKGASLVTVREAGVVAVDHLPLDVVRFEHLRVDVAGQEQSADCLQAVHEALDAARVAADGRLSAVRVELVGATAADRELRRGWVEFVAQCRNVANAFGDVWLERVKRSTTALRDAGDGAEFVAALDLDDAGLREDLRADLAERLGKLRAKLSLVDPQQRSHLDEADWLDALLDAARDEVVQGLLDAEHDGGAR